MFSIQSRIIVNIWAIFILSSANYFNLELAKILLLGKEVPFRQIKKHFFIFFQGVEHLSWLGLFKDMSSGTSLQPFWEKKSLHKVDDHVGKVFEKFCKIRYVRTISIFIISTVFGENPRYCCGIFVVVAVQKL